MLPPPRVWGGPGGGGRQWGRIIKGQAAPVGAIVAKSTPEDAHRREGRRRAWDTESIVYMRELMRDGRLSNELVKMVERAAGRMAA